MQHTTMALVLNQLFVAIPTRPKFNKDTKNHNLENPSPFIWDRLFWVQYCQI